MRGKADNGPGVAAANRAVLQCSELKKILDEGETHSPVGCSYLPAAGVSKDTETDMLGDRSMGSRCYKFR